MKENKNIYAILINSLGSVILLFYFASNTRLPAMCLCSGCGHSIKNKQNNPTNCSVLEHFYRLTFTSNFFFKILKNVFFIHLFFGVHD